MSACAVLNLGSSDCPGHGDNRAHYAPQPGAAWLALKNIAAGQCLSQKEAAEFLEDWQGSVECLDGDVPLPVGQAIVAVRNITIDSLRKSDSSEQALSASRGAFESVTANSKTPLPTRIHFTCQPYQGLQERTFALRLGVLTGQDRPQLTLRIIKQEEHMQEMAQEMAQRVSEAFCGEEIPVLLGQYRSAG